MEGRLITALLSVFPCWQPFLEGSRFQSWEWKIRWRLPHVQLNSDEPAFSWLYWDNENKLSPANSRRPQKYSRAAQQAPKCFPCAAAVSGCHRSSRTGLAVSAQSPSFFSHPRLTATLKGCEYLRVAPTCSTGNSSTKSLPALTSLPRFLFSQVYYFYQTFHTGCENKNLHLQFVHLWY